MSSFWCAVEQGGALLLRQPVGALEGRADLGDHGLDPVGQQGALACLVPDGDGGLLHRAGVGHELGHAAQPGAVDGGAGRLAHHVAGQHAER